MVLHADRVKGYALCVRSGRDFRKVVGRDGGQFWFRTVDQALEELLDVPYLSENIVVVRSKW